MVITDIEDFLKIIRFSLENYCLEICPAKCCSKGKICLTDSELTLIKENDRTNIDMCNGLNVLNLDIKPCPKLNQNNKCLIFDNLGRPKMCSEFPFFLRYKTLIISEFCPATRFLITSKTEKYLEEAGFRVIWQ